MYAISCGESARVGLIPVIEPTALHPHHTGRGIATRAAAALTAVAFRIGAERVEILTDVANMRGAAIPRRLGFVEIPRPGSAWKAGDGTGYAVGLPATGRKHMTTEPNLVDRIVSTQEEMDAAFVDGPPPPGPIVIVDYDAAWPDLYAREERRIRDLLGDSVVAITHVGSTSVPGLAAKPIIDIDLVVPDSADEDAYLPPLVAAGYRLTVREPNWHEHRLFKGPDTNVNVHVFSRGCPEIVRHEVFREWLRAHPEDRDRYAAVKRGLAGGLDDIRAYTEAKNEIIDDIYRRAFAARG
ncbi:MAG TPA: GrpB family protein [Rugosimonospora sp.]